MASLLFFLVLWNLNTISFGELDLEKTRIRAEKISQELHEILEQNTGKRELEKAYETTSCSSVTKVKLDNFLRGLVLSIEKRFNDTQTALLNSKSWVTSHKGVNSTRWKAETSVQDCCTNIQRPLPYLPRFRAEVNTSVACENTHISPSYNQTKKKNLLRTFRSNFDVSSAVSWQYFGSSQGNYLQFPTSPRVCNSTNAFDPRFKSWYVNAASCAHVNVVLVIDRSLSMGRYGRMELARQAGLTVLETLGADDSIGILAFSSSIITPLGCFGATIAQANPSNINQLKKWVKQLQPFGGTKYVSAFVQAFKMLEGVQGHNQTSNATSVILFLTDGDPYDADDDIYGAIRQGQSKMQKRTIINTYGLGTRLSFNAKRRLQNIANHNSGKFTHILDSDASELRSIIGRYYSEIPGTIRDSPIISLPHLDKDLGLVTTMSVACLGSRNDVIGVVAQDVAVSELLKEAVEFSASDGLSYVAVVDTKGRTIIHPSVPKPTDQAVDPVFQSLTLYEPSVKEDMMQKITSGKDGKTEMKAYMSSSRGDPLTDGVHTVMVNATYMWTPVRGSPYIVLLVTANGHIQTAEKHKFVSLTPQSKSYYHRLDLTLKKTNLSSTHVCNKNGYLMTRLFSTVKLAPEAFNDSSLYVTTPETLTSVVTLETFFNDQSPQAMYPGLNESVGVEVMLTAQLERTWNESEHRNPNMVEWRFVATNSGVFRVFPGIRLRKTYSHLKQPWYTRAVTNAGKLTISRSSSNSKSLQIPGSLLSLVTTFNAPRCNTGVSSSSQIAGVIGIQLSQSSFNNILTRMPGLCDRLQQDCFVIDNSGYVISDVLRPNIVPTRHVSQMFPWLATSLASQGNYVKTSWCNNLEDHEVQLFHSLVLPGNGISSSNGTLPCRQYLLTPLADTNAYLLVVRSRVMYGCDENSAPECNQCEAKCSNCTGHLSPCQCPCSCSMRYDECTNSVTGLWTGIPCPASIPKPRDTTVGIKTNMEAILKVQPCPIPCESLNNEVDCNVSSTCHWCLYPSPSTCSKICRTDQRIDLFLLFPCNDFTKLSLSQKYELGKSFIETLMKISPHLTTTAFDNPEFNMTGIDITIHGTTDGISLSNHRDKVQATVEAKSFIIGPTTNVKRSYIAKNSREYTNLQVELQMSSWPAARLTDEQIKEVIRSLQSVLNTLLGESLVSKTRGIHLSKGVISFTLSNEGHVLRYPMNDIAKNLTNAVLNNRLIVQIASKQVLATEISTEGSFDYYCHPTETSTTSSPSVHPSSDSHLTLPPVTKNHTLPIATEEFTPNKNTGLLPTEVYIVIFTALGIASCCGPFVFFCAFRKRRKTAASRRTASPETEIEDLSPEDNGQLLRKWAPPSPLAPSASSFVNPSYNRRGTVESLQVVPEWTRARQNPLQPRANEKKFSDPKSYLEHRASLVCETTRNSERTSKDCVEINYGGKRKVDWKESVQKLKEKQRQERKRLVGLHGKFSGKEEDIEPASSANMYKEKKYDYERETRSSNAIKKPLFKQGFVDCDVDTIVADNQNTPGKRKYRRSQTNRDISMATFRIQDNSNRRQSFNTSSEASPRSSLFGTGVPTTKDQWRLDFDTMTRVQHARPAQAWAKSKRPRLTSRISSLV